MSSKTQATPEVKPEENSLGYIVQEGDTLWDIASQHRGGGVNWPGVYAQNASVIGDNPDLIRPGQELNLAAPEVDPDFVGPRPLADDDYEGQMDRVLAQQELADSFQIVEDDFVGPRLPNQVSREEFENIASTYSDIRRGNTNLDINTAGMTDEDAANYQQALMGDIGEILTTGSGRDLVTQLAYGENAAGNSYTTTINNIANPNGANADWDRAHTDDIGNGVGSAPTVNYAAGVDFDIGATNPDYESAAFRQMDSSTVLFHEMTHALHIRNGTIPMDYDATGARTGFSQVGAAQATIPADATMLQEEYNTVGLGTGAGGSITENRYRRERELVTGTPIPSRDSYAGPGPLPAPAPVPAP